jgi:phenylacetic acid degradation operon negative regulatory protein
MLHFSLAVNNLCNDETSGSTLAPELGLRPLSARSVVLSALLGSHPPVLPIAALVALAAHFEVAAGAVRTAVSRMVAAGELEPVDGGYRLSGRLLDRQREQDLGRTSPDHDWDGSWFVVSTLTPRRSAAQRRRFRSVVEGAKLGELRPETWMRPTNLPVRLDTSGVVISRGGLPAAESRELAGRLWDCDGLATRADLLRAALDDASSQLAGPPRDDGPLDPDIAPGFMVLAACLRFLRTEPQLPTELVASSPANELRARYTVVEAQLQERLRVLFRAAIVGSPAR